MAMKRASFPVAIVLALGLLSLWIGERVFEAGTGRLVLSWLGVALTVGSTLWRLMRSRSATGGAAQVEKALLGLQAVALAGVAMYFAQSDALAKLDGALLAASSPKLAGALSALWPAVLAVAMFPIALMELAYAAMAKSPTVETGRIRDAMYSGLGTAGLLTFATAALYVATERDFKADFSYFRTTKPGEATRKLAQSLDEPVTAAMFFPPANEVSEQVQAYFDDLKNDAPQLKVLILDHALEPVRAKEFGVSGNGVIVVSKGARHESIYLGTELEKAKTQLRGLDQDVQKRLLMVAKTKKTIYLTAGHGERTQEPLGGADQRAAIALLYGELKEQNYELKQLSGAEGLGQEVPKDAAAVMILGPTQPFQAPEANAITEFGKRGGKIFIALDPETGLEFKELLEPMGLKFTSVILANDVAYARKTYTPSDRAIIGTKTFSSHPSVTTDGRTGYPVFLSAAGSLDELPTHPGELSIDFAVRAESSTWNDLNRNYQADVPPEVRKAYGVVAAITRRKTGSTKVEDELRALVLADSDAIADEVLNVSMGNKYLVVDGLKWLFGDEQLQGLVNQETDVAITRTTTQDKVWFWTTIFLGPLGVLGAGMVFRRRKKDILR
jgi:hypothetical protein